MLYTGLVLYYFLNVIIVLWLENLVDVCMPDYYISKLTTYVCDHVKYNIIRIPIMDKCAIIIIYIHNDVYTSFNACHRCTIINIIIISYIL